MENERVVDRFYSLIRPEPEYYCYWNTRVHGLTREDTADAPVFPQMWEKAAPLIGGLPLVAHNSRFDEGCLRAVFRTYCMDYPDYTFHCTCIAPRSQFLIFKIFYLFDFRFYTIGNQMFIFYEFSSFCWWFRKNVSYLCHSNKSKINETLKVLEYGIL